MDSFIHIISLILPFGYTALGVWRLLRQNTLSGTIITFVLLVVGAVVLSIFIKAIATVIGWAIIVILVLLIIMMFG